MDGFGAASRRSARVRVHHQWHAVDSRSPCREEFRRLRCRERGNPRRFVRTELDVAHQRSPAAAGDGRDHIGLMFGPRALPGALGAFLLYAAPLGAQRVESAIDLGAVSLRYADSVNANAVTLTPDLRMDWDRANAQVSGTFSQFFEG